VRISSTAVRQALADDDLPLAETLLGHPFTISGRVVHGDELGAHDRLSDGEFTAAPSGFPGKRGLCGRSDRAGRQTFMGVANIGTRPTVAVRQQLEVHLLDVVMDLYGRHIDVILRKKYATSSDLRRWMS
jgi:riboflavin kinase/FMN adenylyltransferase